MPAGTLADLVAAAGDPARRRLAAAGVRGLSPLTLCVGDEACTLRPAAGEVTVIPGMDPDAGCVVTFRGAEEVAWFVSELTSAPGAHVLGHVAYPVGGYPEFDQWEPAVRALLHGRPVFDPAAVDRERLGREFTVDSPDADIADHFAEFGFAVVRDVYPAAEIDAFNAEIDALVARAEPGTPHTWWTRGADGADVLCQYHYVGLASPVLGALDVDPRTLRFAAVAGAGQEPCGDAGNGHFVVQKHADATEGLTDLPWHIDCGLGGHPVNCPSLHVGIQLTASNPALGAFSVVAGSHRSSVRRPAGPVPDDWPVVTVDTRAGDVTLHATHILHAAPHPTATATGAARRTLYVGYKRPEARAWLGERRSFDDYLFAPDGHVRFPPVPGGNRP